METTAIPFEEAPKEPIPVYLIGQKSIVWNPDHGTLLYRFGYYGNPSGIRKPRTSRFSRPLELSVFETAYLLELGHISVIAEDSKQLTFEEYCVWAGKFRLFEDFLFVYKDLRARRYIPKPGLKFGSDFTVYRRGPGVDHAPFLIKIFPRGTQITPLDIVSAGRLANSVKKRYIMGVVVQIGDVRYYEFKWTKP
ncbi:MAG TPA: tRNA-intron lyase [Candidatus Hodarchaeales archaeon]|nr:tRNA-intron lyase [Candidatus Hodarchaeales archaeon]